MRGRDRILVVPAGEMAWWAPTFPIRYASLNIVAHNFIRMGKGGGNYEFTRS